MYGLSGTTMEYDARIIFFVGIIITVLVLFIYLFSFFDDKVQI